MFAALLDYRKAFDYVNHVKMFKNLIGRGVSNIFLTLLMFIYLYLYLMLYQKAVCQVIFLWCHQWYSTREHLQPKSGL